MNILFSHINPTTKSMKKWSVNEYGCHYSVSLISCYTRIIKISESIIYSERVQTIIRDVQLFSEKEKKLMCFKHIFCRNIQLGLDTSSET